MIIEKILKELTPERIKKENEAIQKVKLPPELQKWVREYERVGGERCEFFWKFIFILNRENVPFKILNKYKRPVLKTKFLITMFIILIDDIVDKIQDEHLLYVLLKIISSRNYKFFPNKLSKKRKKYLIFTIEIYKEIKTIIKNYPLYKKFKEILNYDLDQVINSMRYSLLINKNHWLVNKTEYWLYSPHSLQGMINCTLDLMCVSKFNIKDIAKIREIFWRASKMARISNCLTTWEREFNENDITSSVFIYAKDLNLINIEALNKHNKRDIFDKIRSNVKNKLLEEWQGYYEEIKQLGEKVKLINCQKFLSQLENLFLMYLIINNVNDK